MNAGRTAIDDRSVQICFAEPSGHERIVRINVGQSLMEGALAGGVEGIPADCGGACSCATCHVYVDQRWVDRIASPAQMELDMLECAENLRPNSRLSCQIPVTADLNGMRVEVPEG